MESIGLPAYRFRLHSGSSAPSCPIDFVNDTMVFDNRKAKITTIGQTFYKTIATETKPLFTSSLSAAMMSK
jgi:hypothetical protein